MREQTTAGRLADALEYLEASRQNVRDLRDQLKQADARIAELEETNLNNVISKDARIAELEAALQGCMEYAQSRDKLIEWMKKNPKKA